MIPLKDNIPTDRFPVITVALIAINTFVYFFLQHGGLTLHDNAQVVQYGAIPYEFTHAGSHCRLAHDAVQCGSHGTGPATWTTLFSSMFMHAGVVHLGGNMLFLWIFGNNIEDSMGRPRFVVFYLLGGVLALGAQVAMGPDSTVPTIGASGAIAGVLGAYTLLYRQARVLCLIFIIFFVTVIELPALLVLGFWFVEQLLFVVVRLGHPVGGGGGVAYAAHLGGFVFGLLAIRLFAQRRKLISPVQA